MKISTQIALYDQERLVPFQRFASEKEFIKKMIPDSILVINSIHWRITQYWVEWDDEKKEFVLMVSLKKYHLCT